jgi:DNA repair photolyase
MGVETSPTTDVIRLIKQYGGHIQILTKGIINQESFYMLDNNDWFGITLTGAQGLQERCATPSCNRVGQLMALSERGVKTWISFEPVLRDEYVIFNLNNDKLMRHTDKVKIGKLNYHPSDINWKEFGKKCEAICIENGIDYMIKDGLRREMER